MYDRFKLGLVAVAFLLTLGFAAGVRADDKKMDDGKKMAADHKTGCAYCDAVMHVCSMMRCEKCEGKEQCAHCMEMAKKMEAVAMCKECMKMHKEGATQPVAACKDCMAKMPKEKGECEMCMEKQMVMEHMFCCGKCEAANNSKCPECQKMRKMIEAVKCPECEKKKMEKKG
ncbi:MAG TPA: hypothetical protein VHF22_03730 [Planctomycetota bacterium]|nr:hypothetical protein [Planctomycetota bacterium]